MFAALLGVVILSWPSNAFDNNTIDEIPDSYSLSTNNTLWRSLLKDCKSPTSECVEHSIYKYLKQTLEYPHDYEITSFLKFSKNLVNFTQISGSNGKDGYTKSTDENEAESEGGSPIEEMSRSLHAKSVKFLMTHDLELVLPETIFERSTLKVSPRSFADDGALIKLEIIPREITEGAVEGRIFFKKIKKYVSEKLMYALLAILLVIKLLAAKFMFFLPMMVGVAAAKKLLLKVLLFLFPALHHIFKLCPYVPHGTKFHHHNHHISHIHHVGHGHHKHKHHPHVHPHHGSFEVIAPHSGGPPKFGGGVSLHHYSDHEPEQEPLYNSQDPELNYYSEGPSFGDNFITHRKDPETEENEIQTLGQGQPSRQTNPISGRPFTPTEIENMVLKAEKEALLKARLQHERRRIQEENARLQEQLKQAIKYQEKLKYHQTNINQRIYQNQDVKSPPSTYLQSPPPDQKVPVPSTFNQNHLQTVAIQHNPNPNREVQQKHTVTTKQNSQETFQKAIQQAATITYDPFYSPILIKIDKVLLNLGFRDEPCRERLICSMYKSPSKFSPHSNLLSAELSRDAKELEKPTSTNAAVVRFYRYVQAARDGQDRRDCIRLYSSCSINTEQ